jgi:hypothetical protein
MEDFCVNHNYTQRYLLLPPSRLLLLLLLPLYMYIHCFFRIEKNHPGIVFFARDYASRDQRSRYDKGINWPKKLTNYK